MSILNKFKLVIIFLIAEVVPMRESSFVSLITLFFFACHTLIWQNQFVNSSYGILDLLLNYILLWNIFVLLNFLVWLRGNWMVWDWTGFLPSSLPKRLFLRAATSMYEFNILRFFIRLADQSISLVNIFNQRYVFAYNIIIDNLSVCLLCQYFLCGRWLTK
jgi:hypothetical protein